MCFFKNILNHQNQTISHTSPPTRRTEDHSPITKDEITNTITTAKNGKAPGPDRIYAEHLKDSIHVLQDYWTELFNKCMNTGKIPEQWRSSIIKIMFKGKGEIGNPDS